MYFLIKGEIPLWDILAEARQKDGGLNEFYFSAQLRNVKKFQHLPKMIKSLTLNKLQHFMINLADQFLSRVEHPEV